MSYLQLPGAIGAYAFTAHSAALNITGDIDIRQRMRFAELGRTQVFVSRVHVSGNYCYDIYFQSTGFLVFRTSPNGTTLRTSASTVALTTVMSLGQDIWVRVTKSVATGVITFYYSLDNTNDPAVATWTQLGATVAGVAEGIFAGTNRIEIGANIAGTNGPFNGRVYRTQLRSGIGGTVVYDANFVDQPSGKTAFTDSSSNAVAVTLAGTAIISDTANFLQMF